MSSLVGAAAVVSALGCWLRTPERRTPEGAVPALVLRSAEQCPTGTTCARPTQLTVVLQNDNGLSAPESLLLSLEPRPATRKWPRARARGDEHGIRHARFRSLNTAGRAGAAFDTVRSGAYHVRVERPGSEAALWLVVLAPACWSRLEILVAPSAPPGAVAPSSATLYSCDAGPSVRAIP